MFKFSIILLNAIIFLSLSVTSIAQEQTITLKKPPDTLAKWYKPANKRQVWLHTMFRLRREILAMNDYSEKGQQAELEKWSQKFIKDYQSINKFL